MPKAIKKKIIKKPIQEIEVKGLLSKAKALVLENKNVFITVTASIIMAAVIIVGFFIYNKTTQNKAERLEYEAYRLYYGLYQKQPLSKEDQYTKALEIFKKAYAAKKSPVALYYIANCYYELGKYDETLTTLKELNQEFPDDERFVPLSYYKMAIVSTKKGSNEDALKYLDVLYKYKTVAYKDLSLIESSKILEAIGKTEDAKKKYEELRKDFPSSPFIEEAQARIQKKG